MKLFVDALKILIIALFILCIASPSSSSGGEDVLRLLVWGGYAPRGFVEQFEQSIQEKYDRKVKFKVSFVEKSDDFYDAVREKGADLITISHNLFKDERFNFISKNLLLPLDIFILLLHRRPLLKSTKCLISQKPFISY
nr:hypothetical protein [Desulfobulbaceae bacterium]